MTQPEVRTSVGWKEPPPQATPRLRLKPKVLRLVALTGAWWPHSDDLEAEVPPDLLAVLSVRLGPPISYVLYKMTEWVKARGKILIGGRVVRLDGYNRQPSNTVEVQGAWRREAGPARRTCRNRCRSGARRHDDGRGPPRQCLDQ